MMMWVDQKFCNISNLQKYISTVWMRNNSVTVNERVSTSICLKFYDLIISSAAILNIYMAVFCKPTFIDSNFYFLLLTMINLMLWLFFTTRLMLILIIQIVMKDACIYCLVHDVHEASNFSFIFWWIKYNFIFLSFQFDEEGEEEVSDGLFLELTCINYLFFSILISFY